MHMFYARAFLVTHELKEHAIMVNKGQDPHCSKVPHWELGCSCGDCPSSVQAPLLPKQEKFFVLESLENYLYVSSKIKW